MSVGFVERMNADLQTMRAGMPWGRWLGSRVRIYLFVLAGIIFGFFTCAASMAIRKLILTW